MFLTNCNHRIRIRSIFLYFLVFHQKLAKGLPPIPIGSTVKHVLAFRGTNFCKQPNSLAFFEKRLLAFKSYQLNDKKIRRIVEAYGHTMELFNQLLKISPLRHEMIDQCQLIISSMDENKLRAIMPILQNMS